MTCIDVDMRKDALSTPPEPHADHALALRAPALPVAGTCLGTRYIALGHPQIWQLGMQSITLGDATYAMIPPGGCLCSTPSTFTASHTRRDAASEFTRGGFTRWLGTA